MKIADRELNSVIGDVCSYICRSMHTDLPPEVIGKAKHHILDTLAAMITGSTFKPGNVAKDYVKRQAGVKEAQVIGSHVVTTAINAALANGIMAHADETDDSHEQSLTHPGCAIVPATLAVSEREGADGMTFLKGVVVGYDICCRITQALGVDNLNRRYRSTHGIGGNFGAAAAAAAVLHLEERRVGYVLSYASQQASGVTYWMRDPEHVQKAFVFGGMPARNGVTAALLIQSGFTGVFDPFSGENNFFRAFSTHPKPERLTEGLGSHFEIMSTNIKKFAVGSPIQAPLDALLLLMGKHGFTFRDVRNIVVRLPAASNAGRAVVNDRDMPDINLQYILAVALLDKTVTFEDAHSYKRMKDPTILDIKAIIKAVEDPQLSTSVTARQAIVEVTTKDGAVLREHVVNVRGTGANPMSTEEIEKKSRDLLEPFLGRSRTQKLIDKIWNLERVRNIRELRPLISIF
jgi:2-methylcitrate dehydratase PrpD